MSNVLVIDIGKTHIKLHVFDEGLEPLYSRRASNRVVRGKCYRHFDIEWIWSWIEDGIRAAVKETRVDAIAVTTHGAAAALIDRNRKPEEALLFRIMDYECDQAQQFDSSYQQVRPDFSETFSPDLPVGLNLGRQLFWLQKSFADTFSRVTDILLYPQYWAWRLSGQRCTEVSSLGCHTDLWQPRTGDFSSLVDVMGWRNLFPPVKDSWSALGPVLPEICDRTGLSSSCQVFVGIHDSNASFLRYRRMAKGDPFTMVSTGTWSIIMSSNGNLDRLVSTQDMLANVDAFGEPIACARFMGGREYEIICNRLGGSTDSPFSASTLQALLDLDVMALPDFSGGSGPFPGRNPELPSGLPANAVPALATLYCALMIDYQLDALGSEGDLFIEGAFIKNKLFCGVLAQLRAQQRAWLSEDSIGTVRGCALLPNWESSEAEIPRHECKPTQLKGLDEYRRRWRSKLA